MNTISRSSDPTRNIIPTVASRIRARYSPTCSVKSDSMEINTVKIVSTRSAIWTSCVRGSTASMPPGALPMPGASSIQAMAAAQPTAAIMPPMRNRKRTVSPRIVESATSAARAPRSTIVSGSASLSRSR